MRTMSTSVKEQFPFCIHYPGKDGTKDHVYISVCDDEFPEYITVLRGYAGLGTDEKRRYLPETTCTMEPASLFDEDGGIYTCSNCGKSWQFFADGPKENGWKCCPYCQAIIKEGNQS